MTRRRAERPLPANTGVAILGAGLAGLSTAHHLGRDYTLIEKEERVGGLTRTEERRSFRFDHTGHWLHLRTARTRKWITKLLGGRLIEVARKARVYSHGKLTLYPFQSHAYGLPPEVAKECVLGFVAARDRRMQGDAPEPTNFEEWMRHHYGNGIAEHFMIPYNTKLWGVHPREITAVWCERFVPKPTLEQVIGGAVGANEAELGYNIRFLYPSHGGIEELPRAIAATLDPELIHTRRVPRSIDWKRRRLIFGPGDGAALGYERLVSSIPLDTFVDLLERVPAPVRRAREQLRSTSITYLNVGIRQREEYDFHWAYVPERRLPFYRVGVFSNAAPHMAPAGRGSLYVELAARGRIRKDRMLKRVVDGLIELGLVRRASDVLFTDFRSIPVAYVVFDDRYFEATSTIRRFLSSAGIESIGRFGRWTYNGMEDAIIDGREAAQRWRRGQPPPAA